jgi:glutamyl-tRNA reductase
LSVVVVGLHERDTPLELLERLAISDEELPKALGALCDSSHLAEAVVVSTCLRTEVYAVVERFHDGLADIHAFFAARLSASGEAVESLEDQLFVAYDDAAARHLFEVAAGADSAVLGEGEILRQVRHAADRARRERSLGPVLDALFRHAVEAGKRVRHDTGIARGVTSLAHVAVAAAAEEIGDELGGHRVIVVGAGEMAQGIVGALGGLTTPPELVVANRRPARAAALAARSGGRSVGLSALGVELADADVVISATAGEHPLLSSDAVAAAMAARPARPLVLVDAAVPRDIDPAAGEVAGVRLLDIDDLRQLAEGAMTSRRAELPLVCAILDEELERHRADARGRAVAPLVAALRQRAEEVREAELRRNAGALANLDEPTRELVDQLTRRIVAKLVHEPTAQLKAAAGTPRGERLSEATRALFDL